MSTAMNSATATPTLGEQLRTAEWALHDAQGKIVHLTTVSGLATRLANANARVATEMWDYVRAARTTVEASSLNAVERHRILRDAETQAEEAMLRSSVSNTAAIKAATELHAARCEAETAQYEVTRIRSELRVGK